MAAFALPELLPNKWRHIGVVIAGKLSHDWRWVSRSANDTANFKRYVLTHVDAGIFFTVIVGPVTGKYASTHGPMPLSVAGASVSVTPPFF